MHKSFKLTANTEIKLNLKQIFCSLESKFQKVEIVDSEEFGKMVFVDDLPQSSDIDEALFNEILIHSALKNVENPKRVFIAGGGPGGVLREALKYDTIEEVVLCDIDEQAVTFYQEHLSDWNKEAYQDKRTTVSHQDAREYLKNESGLFDCIVIDVPDPLENGTTKQLFSKEFYELCYSKLTDNGIISSQAGRISAEDQSYYSAVSNTINSVFKSTCSYTTYIPCYFEHWCFVVGLKQEEKNYNENKTLNIKYANEHNLNVWRNLVDIYNTSNTDTRIYKDDSPFLISEL